MTLTNVELEKQMHTLAARLAQEMQSKMHERAAEMVTDDASHHLIYRVLGVSSHDGRQIDLYENKGRFLYRYAGTFLEKATLLCFQATFPEAKPIKIPNPIGQRPKVFEVDCLIAPNAYEIKWRDATTDGDHITKEHARLKAVAQAGYLPTRLMFYNPNRTQAVRIQAALADLYKANGGYYFAGEAAWQHIIERTGVNLRAMLVKIADELGHDE